MSHNDKQIKATTKKLRTLARACDREATICQDAANLCVADDGQHAKSAATWRGRSRTCWDAVGLLSTIYINLNGNAKVPAQKPGGDES